MRRHCLRLGEAIYVQRDWDWGNRKAQLPTPVEVRNAKLGTVGKLDPRNIVPFTEATCLMYDTSMALLSCIF